VSSAHPCRCQRSHPALQLRQGRGHRQQENQTPDVRTRRLRPAQYPSHPSPNVTTKLAAGPSPMTASRRRKTVPAGRNGGCPRDGGCAAYGGVRHRVRGRAGGPPFLALLFPCPVRAAGDECGGAEPPARAVCPPWCLPSSAWAAGPAGRVSLVPVHSSVVHSITSRRPGSGVCHLGWDAPRNPPNALRARAVVLRRHGPITRAFGPGSLGRSRSPRRNASWLLADSTGRAPQGAGLRVGIAAGPI
jgi:hypothetical protein